MLRDDLERRAKKIENMKHHIRYIAVTYEPKHHILKIEAFFLNAARHIFYEQEVRKYIFRQVTGDYDTVFNLVTDVFNQIGIQRIDFGEIRNAYDSRDIAAYADINQIKAIECVDFSVDQTDIDRGLHEYWFLMSDDDDDYFYLRTKTKELSELLEKYERYDLLFQIT